MSGTNRRGALILWVSVFLIAMIRGSVSADVVGQPGELDTSFAAIGSGLNSVVRAIVVQPDGKVLAAGDFTTYNGSAAPYVIRLKADGSRDPSFVQTGSGLDMPVLAMVQQPDGKILVGGLFTTYNGALAPYLLRLNTDGSRDNTFNQPGTGLNGSVWSIVVQPDGKILVAGDFTSYNGAAATRLMRLNADGSRDASFTPVGSGFNGTVRSIVLQPDGKVVAGGTFTTFNGFTATRLVRLQPHGIRDLSFAQPGTGLDTTVQTLALQADGKVLVGGAFTSYNGAAAPRLVRFNADGSRDGTFGRAGVGFNDWVLSVVVQPDDKIIVGGQFTTFGGAPAPRLLRLNPDGSRDMTLVQTGSGLDEMVWAVALQPDGRILAGGHISSYNGIAVPWLARLFGAPRPAILASSTTLAFGDQQVGGSAIQTLTLFNSGTARLVFGPGAVTVSGRNASQFEVAGDTCSASEVPVAWICEVSVMFAPSGTGAMTGRLNVVSNAGTSASWITLSGTGTPAPPPEPTPTVTLPPVVVHEPGPTVTATPSSPVKPFDLAATASTKQVSADWAGSDASYRVTVTGTDPKKKSFAKTVTTQKTAVVVKAKIKAKSKVTVCVRAINAVGTSARTCTSVKAK